MKFSTLGYCISAVAMALFILTMVFTTAYICAVVQIICAAVLFYSAEINRSIGK